MKWICKRGEVMPENRKKKLWIILCMLFVLLLAGCRNSDRRERQNENKNERQESSQTEEDSTSIDPEKIVTKTSGMVERAVCYPDPASLAGASSQIVYGEIERMEYRASMNGGCRTNLEVRVIESYKGNFQEGDIISVALDQGIITVKDYIDSMQSDALKEDSREDYAKYSDDELDDIYYQEMEYGDIMAETGQRSIYFLDESNYYDTERTYCRVTGPEAAYLEISEDCFVKTRNIGMIYAARSEGYTGEINGGNGLEGLLYTRQKLVQEMKL